MRAKQFLILTRTKSMAKICHKLNAVKHPPLHAATPCPLPQWFRLISVLRWWFCCCSSHCLWGFCVLVVVLLCITKCPFKFFNHIDEEERAGCFTLIVFLLSCDCTRSVTLPYSAVGCHGKTPEVCWICCPNHELNLQSLSRAINCNIPDGLCARCHHK